MSFIYKTLIGIGDKLVPPALRPLWEHPAGPKTIFFWAPAGKWTLVLAGLGDIQRPPETISVRQASSLAISSMIWSRWSLVIIPKNYFLFLANVSVFLTNSYQLMRAILYKQSLDKKKLEESKKKKKK